MTKRLIGDWNAASLRPIDPEDWYRLQAAIARCDLPKASRDWLIDLVETVNREEDPRTVVGKMPPRNRKRDEGTALIAMHYWALRTKYGNELAARKEVAKHWKKKEEAVKSTGRRTRVFKRTWTPGAQLDALIETLENEASIAAGRK